MVVGLEQWVAGRGWAAGARCLEAMEAAMAMAEGAASGTAAEVGCQVEAVLHQTQMAAQEKAVAAVVAAGQVAVGRAGAALVAGGAAGSSTETAQRPPRR